MVECQQQGDGRVRPRSRTRLRKPAAALAVVLLLYCISAGPLTFVLAKLDYEGPGADILNAVYSPHTMLTQSCRAYRTYLFWWLRQAKPDHEIFLVDPDMWDWKGVEK